MHSATCQQCGKDFESNLAGRKFCSRECYSKHLASIKPNETLESESSPKHTRTIENDLKKEVSRLTIENARLAGVKQYTEEEQSIRDQQKYREGYAKAESEYGRKIARLEEKQKEELEARPVKIETKIEYKDRIVEKEVPQIRYEQKIEILKVPVSSWLSFKEDFSNSFGLIVLITILAIAGFVLYELLPLILKLLWRL